MTFRQFTREELLAQPEWLGWAKLIGWRSEFNAPSMSAGFFKAAPTSRANGGSGGKPYTEAETRTIRRLHVIGCPYQQIAEHVQRTPEAVRRYADQILHLNFGRKRVRIADADVQAALNMGSET